MAYTISLPARKAWSSDQVQKFDWTVVALSGLQIFGSHLDSWAHQHVANLETFFTPWHAVLYGAFLLNASFLVVSAMANHRRGTNWRAALPAGYDLSLLGVFIFLLGGVGDGIWHTLFGIEVNVEALLSPTHLLLALGGALIVTGPLRALWQRCATQKLDWVSGGPAVISLLYLLSSLNFFTQYAHPFANTLAARDTLNTAGSGGYYQVIGVASVLLQTALLLGPILLVLQRWQLPFGSLTMLFAANTALVCLMVNEHALATGPLPLIIVGLLAGLLADGLLVLLQPGPERVAALRWFAFLAPASLYALYFLALQLLGGGIWWTVHLWTGAIVLAGVVGWLLSFLVAPPASPALVEQARKSE
jgi:hypothetical protein